MHLSIESYAVPHRVNEKIVELLHPLLRVFRMFNTFATGCRIGGIEEARKIRQHINRVSCETGCRWGRTVSSAAAKYAV